MAATPTATTAATPTAAKATVPGPCLSYYGNASASCRQRRRRRCEGGNGGAGGNGGTTTTGMASLTTGSVSYNDNSFQNAAGQFNVAANTGIANINQQGNSVAAHVPVTISNVALGDPIPDVDVN